LLTNGPISPTKAPDRDDILDLFIVNHVLLPKDPLLTSEDGNDGENQVWRALDPESPDACVDYRRID